MTILSQLKAGRQSLSKAEGAIADIVLADPESVVNMATAELARLAAVSDPTVSRFCKSLGCNSFPDFKVMLAQSLVSPQSYFSAAVDHNDDVSGVIEKRVAANQAALQHLKEHVDAAAIEAAVTALTNCKKIVIFGIGGSAAIAKDAEHKLFRLGIPTASYEDHIMQRMVAANSDSETAIIVFSFTGRTKATIEIAEIAKQNNAHVIAITSLGSPLANTAETAIMSGADIEDTSIYVPMTTRIVMLTIIDILATGLTLALEPATEERLQHIKSSLDSTKLPS